MHGHHIHIKSAGERNIEEELTATKSPRLLWVFATAAFFLFFSGTVFAAPRKSSRAYNQLGFEFPLDGGGMLMYSRMWVLNKYLEAGFSTGGGVIERDFDLTVAGQSNLQGHTKSLVLPYFGPRVTAFFHFIGLSVGYGFYYSDTDLDVNWPGQGKLTGSKKGWGTGFYSPLLVLSFFDPNRGVFYGVGLGGFFGTSFPELEARNGASRITTDENPLDTLTLHVSLSFGPKSWRDSRKDDW